MKIIDYIVISFLFSISIIISATMYSSLCHELNTFAEYYSAGVPWYSSRIGQDLIKKIEHNFDVLENNESEIYKSAVMLNAMITEANFH